MLSRRRFLQGSALVAFSPVVPVFVPRLARAAGVGDDDRILVVLQLDGGNDGLNTVVPFADDAYAKSRKTLRLKAEDVLKLDDKFGLPRSMRAAADLFHDGRLAVVQAVGYPNPNRSHFRSMAIWQTAYLSAKGEAEDGAERAGGEPGWIGRAFDTRDRPAGGGTDAVYVGPDDLPRALIGRRTAAVSMASAADLALHAPAGEAMRPADPAGEDLESFVRRRVLEAYGTAGHLADAGRPAGTDAAYPDTPLATRLKLVSQLIRAGGGTRVYYAAQSGYDTHFNQAGRHGELLNEFAGAVKAFLDDLKAAKLSDRVLVMAFSEFGRRVMENDSSGTDHGTAGPVFVAGDGVRPGLVGKPPDLADLQDGDLKPQTDFRRVYATVLEKWLRLPAATALDGTFETVPFL